MVNLQNRLLERETPSAYNKGEGVTGVADRLNLKEHEIIKLDTNENLFIPLNFLKQIMLKVIRELDPRYYPIDEMIQLRNQLALSEGVSDESIVIGTGADQIIELLIRSTSRRGDEVLSITPTFSMYKQFALQNDVGYVEVPLREEFKLDIEAVFERITSDTKAIFLCSPNNPTGNQFRKADVVSLCSEYEGIVVIDETYIDFADYSLRDLVSTQPNLIVMKSFSKSWGLAGLRLGYLIANSEIGKNVFSKYQMPYPVSSFAIKVAQKLLDLRKYIVRISNQVKRERSFLLQKLDGIRNVRAFPTQTNFITFSVDRPSSLVQKELEKSGILVKNLGSLLEFQNCLRMTVPPRAIGMKILDVLEGIK